MKQIIFILITIVALSGCTEFDTYHPDPVNVEYFASGSGDLFINNSAIRVDGDYYSYGYSANPSMIFVLDDGEIGSIKVIHNGVEREESGSGYLSILPE